jgi:hypothetical protein
VLIEETVAIKNKAAEEAKITAKIIVKRVGTCINL